MKNLTICLFVVLAGLPVLVNAEEIINWEKLRQAYMEYVGHPTQINAETLLDELPKTNVPWSEEYSKTVDKIYSNYVPLGELALKGDENAIKILFRLLYISDGAFSEDITIDLGVSVTRHPGRVLSIANNNNIHCGRFVSRVGYEYVDRMQERISELERRRDIIKAVSEPELVDTRKQCIDVLNDKIDDYKQN